MYNYLKRTYVINRSIYYTSSDEQQSFLRPMIIYGTMKRNVHGNSKNHPVYP